MFKLSSRSLNKLEDVNEDLVAVVTQAIELTKIDFGVICGMRTLEEQEKLFNKGASQTMKSLHLEGRAVDLMAYIGSRGSWELNVYDELADAMKEASIKLDVGIKWGGAWTIHDIRFWQGSMEDGMNSYIDKRRSEGRRPFIDAPHFELINEY